MTWPLHNDPRAVFEHEMRRLKALYWPDPGDDELRERWPRRKPRCMRSTVAVLHDASHPDQRGAG